MNDLQKLLTAKKSSDLKQYKYKHDILAYMMAKTPENFIVDSKDGDIFGITHTPTKFRLHVPKRFVPSSVKQASVYYHGSPNTELTEPREGSYVSKHKSIAELMGRFHLDTGKQWSDDDLLEPHKMGQDPKWKKEPKGIPALYKILASQKELDLLDNPYEHTLLSSKKTSRLT